jgi:hypothetical protein
VWRVCTPSPSTSEKQQGRFSWRRLFIPDAVAMRAPSIRSRQVSYGEFDPAVGKLPPIFDDWYQATLWILIDYFACLAASRINLQPEYLRLLGGGHSLR